MDAWSERIVADVEALAETLLTSQGLTLIDVDYRRERNGRILRLTIDKDGGVTVEDCADISGQLGDILDARLDLPGSYQIEVSSPGLDRPLTKPRHFLHFKGRQIAVKTHLPVEGKTAFKGMLGGFSDGIVIVTVEEQTLRIPYENVAQARLDY
jgi:ribosome maturation factor RimP